MFYNLFFLIQREIHTKTKWKAKKKTKPSEISTNYQRLPGVPMDLTVPYRFTILWGRTSKRNNDPHAPVDSLTRARATDDYTAFASCRAQEKQIKATNNTKTHAYTDTHRDFDVHRLLETMTILVIINCNGDEDHERHSS